MLINKFEDVSDGNDQFYDGKMSFNWWDHSRGFLRPLHGHVKPKYIFTNFVLYFVQTGESVGCVAGCRCTSIFTYWRLYWQHIGYQSSYWLFIIYSSLINCRWGLCLWVAYPWIQNQGNSICYSEHTRYIFTLYNIYDILLFSVSIFFNFKVNNKILNVLKFTFWSHRNISCLDD